jgi:hypothetical protein
MGKRLDHPESRTCTSCLRMFTANWPQRLCYRCKRRRASKSVCEVCGGRTNQTGYRRCGPCRYGPAPVLRAITDEELAWLSGLIEGEGSFVAGGKRFGSVRVVMTDKDIIDRLVTVSGVGTVYALRSRQPHHKQAWAWQVVRPPSVASLTLAVAPLLLERRHDAASRVLALHGLAIPSRRDLGPDEPRSWAWTAGLIEGEGYLRPSPVARTRRVGVTVSSPEGNQRSRQCS